MSKIRERRADSTADTYASFLKNQVLPQLGELRLVECDVARLDAFFSRLERARKVVEQLDGLATPRGRAVALPLLRIRLPGWWLRRVLLGHRGSGGEQEW
ncbi:hypothetical protein [Pseudonocardia charpentierae]|uniref:Uncharacterized protein n=1 Tax=Pseudonocardia charpentierae TaxID=3075545 RepID=A0ABU2NIZ6_9PSEU|nr:hypothetical protein [Pseudonocardia sp. DSM 45834]MDT0353945.1 hypothetical protein [Pseudonocardia sp. DSM 45834]